MSSVSLRQTYEHSLGSESYPSYHPLPYVYIIHLSDSDWEVKAHVTFISVLATCSTMSGSMFTELMTYEGTKWIDLSSLSFVHLLNWLIKVPLGPSWCG